MTAQFIEYVVISKPFVDYKSLWHDIEHTISSSTVPNRPIQIADDRDDWSLMCNYWLTPAEAELLKTDPRVEDVSIPLKDLADQLVSPATVELGNFTKPENVTDSSGSFVNWGLIRHSFDYNVYGTQLSTNQNYQYALDGDGVDVVIWDSGIEVNHPEFLDENNQTRVQMIDWFEYTDIPGSMPTYFYTDIDGHGTAVAGIVAGKIFGWAKKSKIYVMNSVPFVPGRSIGLEKAAALIRDWHQQKPVDPVTGLKRPTVVNLSWYYRLLMSRHALIGGMYRGNSWTDNNWNTHWDTEGINPTYQEVPFYSAEANGWLESMQSVGIIICHCAGNSGYKASEISQDPSDDSNNTITVQGPAHGYTGPIYYMRGSSPFASKTITVGAIDTFPKNSAQDKKSSFSNAGSLVKVYGASGGMSENLWSVMTATSTINRFGSWAQNYQGGPGPYQQIYLGGTSSASPQVAGIVALYMQANPAATPKQVFDWITNNSNKSSLYSTGLNDDYTNTESQWGGDGGVAFQNILGLTQIKNSQGQWNPVKDIQVKDTNNSWQPVKTMWIKDGNTWKPAYTKSS